MVLSIALALLDCVPVFFLALGLFFLAQLVDRLDPRSRRVALSGFVLILLGALSRASSNLLIAFSGPDVPLLEAMPQVFGGPGYVLMAAAMLRCRASVRARTVRRDPWIVPTLISWAFLLTGLYLNSTGHPGVWRPLLATLAFLGTVTMALAAVDLGLRRQLHVAALLFAFLMASSLTLLALRSVTAQPVLLHVFEAILSIAAQAAFAFGSWRVAAEYRARIGPTAPE
ncbi:MAG: hypothetical protein ABI672_12835 [Vicinamibacteria bacterium]